MRAILAGGLFAALMSCGDPGVPTSVPSELALGTWGGDNAGVIVTDTATHVHIGCTFGDIKGRVSLDASGRFALDGTYVLRAYPIFIGPELPAQFSGVVDGNRLTLAVAVNDTVSGKVVSLGPVSVTFGKTPDMGPCPICSADRIGSRQ